MAGSMNQFWLGGNYQQPMPGYQADPNAKPVFFDHTSELAYAAQNTPFGGAQAPAPHVVNPTLGNNQNMPVTQWSNPAPAAQPAPTPAPTPAPAPAPAPAPQANPYEALINKAWDAQTELARGQVNDMWSSSMADRGLLPAAAAAQDAYGRALSPVMQQLAAGRAGDLANAHGREQAAQMERERFAAQQAYQDKQLAWQQQQDAKDRAWQQGQFDWQKQQALDAQKWATTQQQWATQDRDRQQQAANNPYSGLTGGAGTGGATPAPSFFDLIANQPGYSVNGQGSGSGGSSGSGGYQGQPAGGGGTTFLPGINAGSDSGLWGTSGGGTTWHNPNNAAKPWSPPAGGQRPTDPIAGGATNPYSSLTGGAAGSVTAGITGAAAAVPKPQFNPPTYKPKAWGT